jgi:hypothetical protein
MSSPKSTKCEICDAARVDAADSSATPMAWKEFPGKFLSGYASGLSRHVFSSLKEAQDAARKDATATSLQHGVGGITFERPNRFTLRTGTKLEDSPSGEVSWMLEPVATAPNGPLKCRCCNKFEVWECSIHAQHVHMVFS